MTRYSAAAFLLSLVFTVLPRPAAAQLAAQQVAEGLSSPVGFVQVPSDPTAQVILEQGGRVRLFKDGVVQPADYLDLTGFVSGAGGEAGLLGLAFSPHYRDDGRVFVCFVDQNGNTVISRFQQSADDALAADPASRFDLVWPGGLPYIEQFAGHHYGGNLAFGADGFLYIGLGDGDDSNDPGNHAQDPLSLKGKILRLDVSVPDADGEGYDVPAGNPFTGRGDVLGEIWAVGLRNPWRWSFDDPTHGGTGALVIGDVGQDTWEEVDYEPAGAGGRNFGWRNREGANDNVTDAPPFSEPLTDPVFEFNHDIARSIIGGFVYRGQALGAQYRGRYIFGDFVAGDVWSVALEVDSNSGEAAVADLQEHRDLSVGAVGLSSFGVDASGELYLVSYLWGTVSRIVRGTPPTPSANGCTTPDPFTALGGGTCLDGGWLPPGASPPPSVPPPAPPPTSGGGCTTADPFMALGGGTCLDGGWLPPGSSAPPSVPPPVTPPPPPSGGGCTTPDPFGALGGGTCLNGGWLPPGSSAPPSVPPPVTPPPPPSGGGCTTPDPFVALGGGTCLNGGWLPPGSSAPPSVPPPVTLPPPPSGGGCATPDPFAALGGGTCLNGGWQPPSASLPPSVPPPAPPPVLPPPSGVGCATPDPFSALGGGTCLNGGWLPPGASLPPPPPPPSPSDGGCTTPDPFTALGGGTCLNGGWLPPNAPR